MIDKDIGYMLFGDLETTGITDTLEELDDLNKPLANMFRSYFDDGVLCRRFPDKECETASQMFSEVAALFPEFCRVVAGSFGRIHPKTGKWYSKDFANTDERVLILDIDRFLRRQSELDIWLNIYNGKYFDIPVLCKKFVQYGVTGNPLMPTHDMKPWDYRIIDPKDVWQLGQRSSPAKLELVCAFLEIDTPKDGPVKGSNLHRYFWDGMKSDDPSEINHRMSKISEYCAKDVVAIREITKKLIIKQY
jgi:hypothetical protein